MKEQKKTQSSKTVNKGFTLIELLVVVLIIGILAAIALPQYQKTVAKTKFGALKNITRSIADAAARYYLVNNEWPQNYKDLDLDFAVRKDSSNSYLYPKSKNDIDYCSMWYNKNEMAACYTWVSNRLLGYYVSYNGSRPKYCYTNSKEDKGHITHKICQEDTGKTEEQASCISNYCIYYY